MPKLGNVQLSAETAALDDRGHAEARDELAAGQGRRRFEFGL
jgi:hypothetical protein